jgi:hypothetical protein
LQLGWTHFRTAGCDLARRLSSRVQDCTPEVHHLIILVSISFAIAALVSSLLNPLSRATSKKSIRGFVGPPSPHRWEHCHHAIHGRIAAMRDLLTLITCDHCSAPVGNAHGDGILRMYHLSCRLRCCMMAAIDALCDTGLIGPIDQ